MLNLLEDLLAEKQDADTIRSHSGPLGQTAFKQDKMAGRPHSKEAAATRTPFPGTRTPKICQPGNFCWLHFLRTCREQFRRPDQPSTRYGPLAKGVMGTTQLNCSSSFPPYVAIEHHPVCYWGWGKEPPLKTMCSPFPGSLHPH